MLMTYTRICKINFFPTPPCQILYCIPYDVCKLCKLNNKYSVFPVCRSVTIYPGFLKNLIWTPSPLPSKIRAMQEIFWGNECSQEKKGKEVSSPLISHLHVPRATQQYYVTKNLISTCKAVYSPAPQSLQLYVKARTILASHAGVFRGASILSLPTNPCSTENNNTSFPKNACVGG